MNTVPGFTAEASLYPSSTPLQIRAMLVGHRQEGEVVPSAFGRDPAEVEGAFDAWCDDYSCSTIVWVPGLGSLFTSCDFKGGCRQFWS
jgi:hypothetical protein